ncbi:unnamed protein product [Chrysodeixis includens]|uniref:Uncharacterized protein n=1 Tax=Chrysodeixis includens TaxID=689277 RepID=A0A9P0FVV0_CHRIL|nr:unnamed protein product [Chrysodeixis includens]
MKVNSFLEEMKENLKLQKASLRSIDYKPQTDDYLDYTLTDFWWTGVPMTGAITARTSFIPIPNYPIFTTTAVTESFSPETTTEAVTTETEPTNTYPPGFTPSFTLETRPTTSTTTESFYNFETRLPGPGQYIPSEYWTEATPAYELEQLATLTTTTPTPRAIETKPFEPTETTLSTVFVDVENSSSINKNVEVDEGVEPDMLTSEVIPAVWPGLRGPVNIYVTPVDEITEEYKDVEFTNPTPSAKTDEVVTKDAVFARGPTANYDDHSWPLELPDDPTTTDGLPPFDIVTDPNLTSSIDTTPLHTMHPNISNFVEKWVKEKLHIPDIDAEKLNLSIFDPAISTWVFYPSEKYTPNAFSTTNTGDIIYPEDPTETPFYKILNISGIETSKLPYERQGKTRRKTKRPTPTQIQETPPTNDSRTQWWTTTTESQKQGWSPDTPSQTQGWPLITASQKQKQKRPPVTPSQLPGRPPVTPSQMPRWPPVTPSQIQETHPINDSHTQWWTTTTESQKQGWPPDTPSQTQGWPLITASQMQKWPPVASSQLPGWPSVTPSQMPGWPPVTPSQTQGWPLITASQMQKWPPVAPSQLPGWSPVTPSQMPGWPPVTPSQTQGWPLITASQIQEMPPVTQSQMQELPPITPSQIQELLPVTPSQIQQLPPVTPSQIQGSTPINVQQRVSRPATPIGPTQTGIPEGLIVDGPFGFPKLGTTPSTAKPLKTTLKDGVPAMIPDEIELTTPTTAGDVLHGKIKVEVTEDPLTVYMDEVLQEADRLGMGYMSIFLIRVTKLVATGKKEHIQPVLMHTELILTRLFDAARLAYLGQPLLRVTMNLGMAIAEPDAFDELHSYASMVYHMLLDRKKTAGMDVNSIVDYADSLYTDEDGESLLMALKQFEDFPNTSMPSMMICETIIEAFMAPHRRLKGTDRGRRLIDSINYALEARFPHLKDVRRQWSLPARRNYGTKQITSKTTRSNNKRYHGYNNKIISLRRRNYNQTSVTTQKIPLKRSKGVKKKQKTKDKTDKPHSDFNYERMLRKNMYLPNSLEKERRIEQTTTTTNTQKRFSIITLGHNNYIRTKSTKKPTTQTFIQLKMRRTTDYRKKDRQRFRSELRATRFFQNTGLGTKPNDKSASATKRKKRKLEPVTESIEYRKKKSKEIKNDLLRLIVEGSSYSDEEEALKLNLISAMIHGNRTFQRTEINETMLRAFLKEQEEIEAVPTDSLNRLGDASSADDYKA